PEARVGPAQGVIGDLADGSQDLVERPGGIDVMRNSQTDCEGAGVAKAAVALDGCRGGVAVDDRGDSHRGVVCQKLEKPTVLVELGWLALGRFLLDVSRAVAEDPGWLAGVWVFFDLAGPINVELLVDSAKLERERVDRRVGAGREEDRVMGRSAIELIARGVALLLEPRDENLPHNDPAAGAQCFGSRADVIEHI